MFLCSAKRFDELFSVTLFYEKLCELRYFSKKVALSLRKYNVLVSTFGTIYCLWPPYTQDQHFHPSPSGIVCPWRLTIEFAAIYICRISQGFQFCLFRFHLVWNLYWKRNVSSIDSLSCFSFLKFSSPAFGFKLLLYAYDNQIFHAVEASLTAPCWCFSSIVLLSSLKSISTVVLKPQWASESPAGPDKTQVVGLHPHRGSHAVGLRWSLRILISDRFPGDVDTSDLGTTLGQPWQKAVLFKVWSEGSQGLLQGVHKGKTVFIIIPRYYLYFSLHFFHKYMVVFSRVSMKCVIYSWVKKN